MPVSKNKTDRNSVVKADQDLNRWCIEMAMRWPVHVTGNAYGAQAVAGYIPRSEVEADIISRANRIRTWVKQTA